MVRVNKTERVQVFREKAWEKFHGRINQSSLKILFTPSEIVMIEKRLIILLLIEKGMSCREIGRLIDVSPSTVNFVKHHFTRKPAIHRRYSALPKKNTSRIHRSSKGTGIALWK